MPFTFSHPAAVIPFTKRKLILSAAIIGSMAPDFEYFLRFSTRSHYGHTFPGIFFFSLPIALFVLWLFQLYIKNPVIALLPSGFQQRLTVSMDKFKFFPARRFLLIILSLFTGILSHIAWDSLTHSDGFIVLHLSFFRESIEFRNIYFPFYNLLQHISTIIGGLAIGILIARWYKRTPARKSILLNSFSDRNKILITTIIFISACILGLLYGSVSLDLLDSLRYIRKIIGNTVVNIISFMFIEFVVYSIIWNIRFANDGVKTE